ncbi:Wzz/FepE/Etk N-terminal domain-containing protein [Vibrio sinaloensis]|nr:Wzz/FepE/Etk N-terminal domain-containing protein [Vibrio sinaloensis]UPQ88144.1 Wzz/FepE/Etk N-terminal domain-containing protein [Vibrio sinaloensis]
MSGQNQQPPMNQQYAPQIPPSFQNNDEIDLRELFKALWDGKLIICVMTIVTALGAAGYAFMKPNLYQAQSSFLLDKRFFDTSGVYELDVSSELISSQSFKKQLSEYSGLEESMLSSINLSKRGNVISISQISMEAKAAFDRVSKVSDVLNDVLKQQELNKVQVTLDSLRANTGTDHISLKSQDYLDELLAQQLFKKAMLQSPKTQIVTVLSQASLPTSHIKPKRALIITLGTLLGGMLGVAIVLVRFAFRREED